MKFLSIGARLFIGVISISMLAACGGGSGGPGGPIGATGGGGTGATGGLTSGGNLAGISLTDAGGLHLSIGALETLGLNVNALTPADLADLHLTGPLPVGVEVLRSNGQLVGIQLPGAGAFALPGAGPVALPGGIALPALPAGGVNGLLKRL